MQIFDSNCPRFFDVNERKQFDSWLTQLDSGEPAGPADSNPAHNAYFVAEENGSIIGCAGYYVLGDLSEARLAWGMVNAKQHSKGIGSMLFRHRAAEIIQLFPQSRLTLGTSQHTYPFYERMGMKVVRIIPAGYGPQLDRVDMEL